jgi:hypothetical protein
VSAFLLAAIGGTWWKTSIAFSADCLVAVESLCQQSQSGIIDSTSQSENKVKSRFLLNIVIAQSASILKLLSGKDKTLLIRGDSFLILNLGLDVVNGVAWFDIKSDGLTSQGLYKNLHGEWFCLQRNQLLT